MSALISPSPVGTGATSSLPSGWIARWSPDRNAWYYTFTATGMTQWEYPADRPRYSPVPDQQRASCSTGQYPSNPADDTAGQERERGIGKTALAIGSGYVLGSSLGNKDDHHHHYSNMGKIAMAGAGVIGAKIISRIGKTQQPAPPQPCIQVQLPTVYVPEAPVPGPDAPPYYGQSSPGSQHYGPPSPGGQHYGPPSPGSQQFGTPSPGGQHYGPPSPGGQHYGPPSPGGQHYGPPSPGGQNYGQHPPGGHFAGNTNAVAPMAITPPPHQYGGVSSPPSVGMGAFTAPPSGPPLYIYGAAFADRDVTQIVRSLVTPQQTLTLTGDMLVQRLGDPWPQVERKSFNVLYSYGDRPMELLAAETSTANIEIKNEALSKKRIEFCHGPPSRIIACVWGLENPLTAPRLEQLEKYGEMEGSEAACGSGGFWRWEPKTLVCYYRTETGGVGIACCRHGGTIRLPWNPLAKWS